MNKRKGGVTQGKNIFIEHLKIDDYHPPYWQIKE